MKLHFLFILYFGAIFDGLLAVTISQSQQSQVTTDNRPAHQACQTFSKLPRDRIIGEKNVVGVKEFPWMAALGVVELQDNYKVNFVCGGTLISDRYVLTAAHCFKDVRLPNVVRLGKINLIDSTDDDVDALSYYIKDVIKHPNYSTLTKRNDIALVRMTNRVSFSPYVIPACINTQMRDEASDVKLSVTGWGLTSAETRERSNILLKTTLGTVPLSQCNDTYLKFNIKVNSAAYRNGIFDGQYCAADPTTRHANETRNDSCEGDSGGPLQLIDGDSAFVVGIVSFGIGCGTELPGVYTRVAYYSNWIESIVWSNTLGSEFRRIIESGQVSEILRWINKDGADVNVQFEDGLRAIHIAAKMGNVQAINVLLNNYANVDAQEKLSGKTALHFAAEKGFQKIVERLIASNANVNKRDNNIDLPLRLAIQKGYRNIAAMLIEAGSDVDLNLGNSESVVFGCLANNDRNIINKLNAKGVNVDLDFERALSLSVTTGDTVSSALIIRNCATKLKHVQNRNQLKSASESVGLDDFVDIFLRNERDDNGKTPLHFAAQNGQTEAVRVLVENGAEINAVDNPTSKTTPLHLAASNDRKEVALFLLQNGADVNAKDSVGDTPLFRAAFADHKDMVLILLKQGADVDAKSNNKFTSLHLASWAGQKRAALALIQNGAEVDNRDQDKRTPLHYAAKFGHRDVAQVLIKNGADVEAKDKDEWRPLHFAAFHGKTESAFVLIQNAADINIRDRVGDRPLHKAAWNAGRDTVIWLISRGAEVDAPSNNGFTSLHLAAWFGQKDAILALIEKGANVRALTHERKTPRALAESQGQTEAAEILKKAEDKQ